MLARYWLILLVASVVLAVTQQQTSNDSVFCDGYASQTCESKQYHYRERLSKCRCLMPR